MDNHIGEALRRCRLARRMTQENLAETLHVTRQAVSNWENGRTQPDADTLARLAALFGVTLDELVTGTAAPERNRPGLLLCGVSAALSLGHLVLAALGFVNPVGVLISVFFASAAALIQFAAFEGAIRRRDYSLLAGHRREEEGNPAGVARRLRRQNRLLGGLSLGLNLLYVPAYWADPTLHMGISLVFFLVFLSGLGVSIWLGNRGKKN